LRKPHEGFSLSEWQDEGIDEEEGDSDASFLLNGGKKGGERG